MSVHQTLAGALPVVGMGEKLGLTWGSARDLPDRVPPPTRLVGQAP
jgi:hypothetical protein